jgi:phenylpyruvate tautomerase PptA (4-oxalocrotonate tautomerase family)
MLFLDAKECGRLNDAGKADVRGFWWGGERGAAVVDYGNIGVADGKRAEVREKKQSVISGIQVELVVEVLGLSWSKVVVVVRSKQKLARSQHSRTRNAWCASLKI